MSPDLSNLKLKQEAVPEVDFEGYVDAQEFPPPVPAGVYTLKQGKPTFDATADGYLSANMTHTVEGGEYNGRSIAFDRVSNKPFDRQGVKVSMAMDHIRALPNTNGARPHNHEEYAALIEAGEGQFFRAQLDWEGGCNHEGTAQQCDWNDKKAVVRIKGERSFPELNGVRQNATKCPTCGKDIMARNRVSRRIPAGA